MNTMKCSIKFDNGTKLNKKRRRGNYSTTNNVISTKWITLIKKKRELDDKFGKYEIT